MTAIPPDAPAAGAEPEPPEFPSPSIVDSRRLMGPNLYSALEGAVLEVRTPDSLDASALYVGWADIVRATAAALTWPEPVCVVRRDVGGAQLFFSAPVDALMTATEVNEQAWVLVEALHGGHARPGNTEDGATAAALLALPDNSLRASLLAPALVERIRASEVSETATRPHLRALHAAATSRGFTLTFDDEAMSLGSGEGSRTWTLADAPSAEHAPWETLHDVPVALVTGSNGKTTTTRLVAAMWREAGQIAGWCCSDGVWVDGQQLDAGDFAGPAGARAVLRDTRVQAAVLETARGGLLRRGLAVPRATAAIITNIAPDHFGEYGIHGLHDLLEAKGVLAHAIGSSGCLVLNADDPMLLEFGEHVTAPLAWFSMTSEHPVVKAHTATGGDAVMLRAGHVMLHLRHVWHDLGDIHDMPLTLGGAAPHNAANILGATMLGAASGVPVTSVRATLQRFGADVDDNPGRLQVLRFGSMQVLVDYAHNPDGLAALCRTARAISASRRLLVLGQAGNRDDDQLRALVGAALAEMPFDRVIIKEMVAMLRGRTEGEVPRVLAAALVALGVDPSRVEVAPSEIDALRRAFLWARDGDVLVCPVHVDKAAAHSWFQRLRDAEWRPGLPLPA